ncbi:MAG: ribonuclease HII, partial [Nanoarchaeota archaeon]|nr:ribonuclease HII [Nanoarchaeota archaeon]
MILCGIDEAGRGPVIGPMVMAGVIVDEQGEAELKSIGVKDSKLLSPKEREDLFKKILSIAKDYKIVSLPPETIDSHMRDPNSNLNMLEAKTSSEILSSLKPDKAYIDLPDRNVSRYREWISSKLPSPVDLICEHKADQTYPVCSAASIIAKVTRDRYLDMLREQFGEDFGSGYTSDP